MLDSLMHLLHHFDHLFKAYLFFLLFLNESRVDSRQEPAVSIKLAKDQGNIHVQPSFILGIRRVFEGSIKVHAQEAGLLMINLQPMDSLWTEFRSGPTAYLQSHRITMDTLITSMIQVNNN